MFCNLHMLLLKYILFSWKNCMPWILDKRNMQRAASWFIIESLKIKALIRRLTWCEQKAFKEKVGTLTGGLQEKYWDERVKTVHCLFRQALLGRNFKKMEEVCSIKSHHSNANQNGKWETPTVQRNLVSFVIKVKAQKGRSTCTFIHYSFLNFWHLLCFLLNIMVTSVSIRI